MAVRNPSLKIKKLSRFLSVGLLAFLILFGVLQNAIAATGSGDLILETSSKKKPVLVQLFHQGNSNFIVWAADKSASRIDLVANEIGNYSGTVLLELSNRERLKFFEVTADGTWSIEVKGLKKAPNWKGRTYSGIGDQVIELKKTLRSNTVLNISNNGDSNFIVWTYDKNGKKLDLKVNEIGSYSGQKFLGSRVKYISIQSDGEWTIAR